MAVTDTVMLQCQKENPFQATDTAWILFILGIYRAPIGMVSRGKIIPSQFSVLSMTQTCTHDKTLLTSQSRQTYPAGFFGHNSTWHSSCTCFTFNALEKPILESVCLRKQGTEKYRTKHACMCLCVQMCINTDRS